MTAALLQQRLRSERLSLFGFSILGQCRAAPTRVKNLADSVRTSFQNCSAVVDRMEGKGWVLRVRDEADRRKVFVHLTPAGKELLGRVEA